MDQKFTRGAARIAVHRLHIAVADAKASARYYWLRDKCTAEQSRSLFWMVAEAVGKPDRAERLDMAIDQMITEELTRELWSANTVAHHQKGFLRVV